MAEKEHSKTEKNEPIFHELSADDPENGATEIESLCMNCGNNGVTRLLLTKIPHYKDVVIMSFACDHCGYRNNEIQNGGKIEEKGIKIVLKVTAPKDLNRQVIKSDYTQIEIPDLDFEIPMQSQSGEVTTIEGIINRVINNLESEQPKRREENPEIATGIASFIDKLNDLKELAQSFTIIFVDISGNCHIENPNLPNPDDKCRISKFKRSKEQNHILGIFDENKDVLLKPIPENTYTLEDLKGEVLTFQTNCPHCNNICETNMKLTNIPHFKEVVIMATLCDACGHRTNEVKSSGGIEPQGVKIEVQVTGKEDFSRDLLKSETCQMEIPELDLEVGAAALGGRFTTVEGIIVATKEQLESSTAFTGDSSEKSTVKKMKAFISQIDKVLAGEQNITLVLNDPAGNSYVQSLSDDGLDDRLKITKYDRTFEQNDELGLNDMKVENY